jgi:prepilin-type N-terminal cleavage/methylation domain-containing protein/prepilin-type processing-associated H-X9-DG protein
MNQLPWVRLPKRSQAFTLIELLVVVAILAILAGLLLPAVNLVKTNAVNSTCQSQQRQVMAACLAYLTDQENMVPYSDFVSGSDWPTVGTPSALGELLEIHAGLPIPSYMVGLGNTRASSQPVDLMARATVTQCPLVRMIFQTQNPLSVGLGSSAQNLRPNYIAPRSGPPSLSLLTGSGSYTAFGQIAKPAQTGFVFCANFRLDRLGGELPNAPTTNPTCLFPVHELRKEAKYTSTAYGNSFDVTDPNMYRGRINVSFWDGHVDALAYQPAPGTLASAGGGDRLLPAATPNSVGSAYSHFMRGGN